MHNIADSWRLVELPRPGLVAAALLVLLLACADQGPQPPRDACCTVRIDVTVPADAGAVYLAGNLDQLGAWSPDGVQLSGAGTARHITLSVPPGTALEYKFTLGSWEREALTTDKQAPGNYALTVEANRQVRHTVFAFKEAPMVYIKDWRNSGVNGTLVYRTNVSSKFLGPNRHIEIWLPPGYHENTDVRYPVLYMHDGQNLFDPRIANTGIDWGVDEAVVSLVEAGKIDPVIVVGVWSTTDRGIEYSPWHGAPDYARFLIEELKPSIDRHYRTLPGPRHTAAMGSSMGGLLSYYLVSNHPDVFGACGCLSTHFPFTEKNAVEYFSAQARDGTPDTTPYILRDIAAGARVPAGARYWFDHGTRGLDAEYGPTHDAVRQWLSAQGLTENKDFVIREYSGADHNEAAWRARVQDSLLFLFARPAPAGAHAPQVHRWLAPLALSNSVRTSATPSLLTVR